MKGTLADPNDRQIAIIVIRVQDGFDTERLLQLDNRSFSFDLIVDD